MDIAGKTVKYYFIVNMTQNLVFFVFLILGVCSLQVKKSQPLQAQEQYPGEIERSEEATYLQLPIRRNSWTQVCIRISKNA